VPSRPAPSVSASTPSEPPSSDSQLRPRVTPSGSAAEQRRHRRTVVELDVSLHTESRYFTGFTENLSLGGAFVATHLVQPVNALVRLVFHFDEEAVEAVGEVRWTRDASESGNLPPGMGIRFVAIKPGRVDPLATLLRRQGDKG